TSSKYEDENLQQAIGFAEKELKASNFPYQQIWHSIIAHLYEQYFNNHQYQILGRTPLQDPSTSNFEFWDAHQFYNIISLHYLQSLIPAKQLQEINAKDFQPILTKALNTQNLRPTLYDIL